MTSPIYLDNNATTQPLSAVVEAMREALSGEWANPSSIHRLGTAARRRVELARESVARLIGCQERELVFCSGGSESVGLALFGTWETLAAAGGRRRVLLTSRLEHSAVRESAARWTRLGGEVLWAEHRPDGVVDCDWLAETLRLRGSDIALVSLMWVNNETGVIAPIERIGALCRAADVRFHVDATQCVGRWPIDLSAMQVDLLSFAAHKFHGPKGIGGLYLRRGVRVERQVAGGPQERDRRGGTENVPGIVGMGVAADAARRWLAAAVLDGRPGDAPHAASTATGRPGSSSASAPSSATPSRSPSAASLGGHDIVGGSPASAHARDLHPDAGVRSATPDATLAELQDRRDRFERILVERCPGAVVNAAAAPRLWSTSNVGFPRLEAEAILLLLSERGVCASAGAACSSGSLDPSPVLLAMGIPEPIAHGSIRFSFARSTDPAEIDAALDIIPSCIARLAKSSSSVL